jgi:replicative DNA helicase
MDAILPDLSFERPDQQMPRLLHPDDLLAALMAEATEAHAARLAGRALGPVTGLPTLDRELGGRVHVGVHILHAQPGLGKTALALQMGATCDVPCLYVTAEMSPVELLRRHTARTTGTYLGRLKSGELSPDAVRALVVQALQTAPGLVFGDATECFATPKWLEDAARTVRGDARYLLIVMDSLHSWVDALGDMATEYDRLNAGLAMLQRLTTRLDCAVLAIAERNRSAMDKGGLSAGAGSRKIEYGAASVLDLERDDKAGEDAHGGTQVKLKIAKNRHGPKGKVITLTFNGALQQFQEAG